MIIEKNTTESLKLVSYFFKKKSIARIFYSNTLILMLLERKELGWTWLSERFLKKTLIKFSNRPSFSLSLSPGIFAKVFKPKDISFKKKLSGLFLKKKEGILCHNTFYSVLPYLNSFLFLSLFRIFKAPFSLRFGANVC